MVEILVCCVICKKERRGPLPIRCRCGQVIGQVSTSSVPSATYYYSPAHTVYPTKNNAAICRTNNCGHYNKSSDTCQQVIDLAALKGQTKAGYISYIERHPQTNCPAEVPQWPNYDPTPPIPNTVLVPRFNDRPVEPKNKLAIISVAIGKNATEESTITFPRFQEYADFVGADFIEVRDDQFPSYPIGNKLRIGEIVSKYSRTLFLDVDIWLRSNVGNMFELFESGSVWMHPDKDRFNNDEWFAQMAALFEMEQGVIQTPSRCFNSGVVLFDREHCEIWSPPPKLIGLNHVSEQLWVEHQAINMGVKELPWEYNCQWYWLDFAQREPHAKVVHLANCPHDERMVRLQKLRNQDGQLAYM